jgi:hypothetical protein
LLDSPFSEKILEENRISVAKDIPIFLGSNIEYPPINKIFEGQDT